MTTPMFVDGVLKLKCHPSHFANAARLYHRIFLIKVPHDTDFITAVTYIVGPATNKKLLIMAHDNSTCILPKIMTNLS